MPSIVRGNTITLTGQYVDGSGYAATPTSPLIDIIDPIGTTIINNAAPVAVTGSTGLYEYEYDVAGDAEVGTWTIVWTGIVNSDPITASEEFDVLPDGVPVEPDCPENPLWFDPDLFALQVGSTLDEAIDAIAEATWVLWSLTDRRFHKAECRRDIYMSRPGMCVLELEHGPVDEVLAVFRDIDGTTTESDSWRHINGQRVRLCCSSSVHLGDLVLPCHTCTDDSIIVDYRVGSNLPPGAARVTKRLALEFYKSATGAPCNLPERITSVNRQGVSWTILDPLDFLDKGLTGIGAVDSWITAVNGRGVARLIDPLHRPPLVESTVTGCGEGCGEV